MRESMARAPVGDDVWEEDPTVKRLEALVAERLGKAAGLFVTSGTMGNLVSVVSQTQTGQEVVLDLDSHIFNYEVAGAAVIGNVQMRPVKTARGFLAPDQVREALRPANIHLPPTGLVCVENTHNRHGGTCCTPEEISAIAAVAHEASVPVHLDGARLFNAAVALKRPARDLAEGVSKLPGLSVDLASVQTNIVIFRVERGGTAAASAAATAELVAGCGARKVKIHAIGPTAIRCVTHKDIDAEDIGRTLDAFAEITRKWYLQGAPWPNDYPRPGGGNRTSQPRTATSRPRRAPSPTSHTRRPQDSPA